jgi:hypothetical protein
MQRDEASFLLRFSLEAEIPDRMLEQDDFDERAWIEEWERSIKPAMLRAVFQALRAAPGWDAHVRTRGAAVEDEIEIVLRRTY